MSNDLSKQTINEDEWEEVYNNLERFEKYCPNNLSYIKDGMYYNTYGGGPEGGYVKMANGDVYKVERNWGTSFKATKCKGAILIYRQEDEMKGITAAVYLM